MSKDQLLFPDESGYARSEDGSEPIRPNSSVGLNRILGLFKNFASVDKTPRWGIYLLNAYTITRNILSGVKERPKLPELLKLFDNEVTSFVTYSDAYESGFHRKKPIIVALYFPDYSKIPDTWGRPLTGEKLTVFECYQEIKKQFPNKPTTISYSQISARVAVPVGGRSMFPYEDLTAWVRNICITGESVLKWGDPVFLMTHCPTDLHIYRKVPWVQLVESYQGIIKLPKEFGSKLVPGSTTIPFNATTHRLFGDSVQVKPLVTGRNRTALIELAKTKNWMMRSSDSILSDAKSIKGIDLSAFGQLKFN